MRRKSPSAGRVLALMTTLGWRPWAVLEGVATAGFSGCCFASNGREEPKGTDAAMSMNVCLQLKSNRSAGRLYPLRGARAKQQLGHFAHLLAKIVGVRN